MMSTVNDFLNFLDKKFPFDTACDFDNVGLLIGDKNCNVKKVLIALDCDINTVNAAIKYSCDLIITHHPVIFDGVKSITEDTVCFKLIKNNISVISCHTNLDIAKGGVSESLCKAIGLKSILPYKTGDGFIIRKAKVNPLNADALALMIKSGTGFDVRYADAKNEIKTVLVCSGSGNDFFSDALNGKFDAYISAEIKQSTFIKAINCGISVFDAGHYASENVVINPLLKLLESNFKNTEFLILNNENIRCI
ncbi:MAG: Nif3-like dinuclear metal center hexameric protein [Clostridia bacterium]|nr:Nif3-like dinuclear metal center hexameric protein [Clostridia bacterium]